MLVAPCNYATDQRGSGEPWLRNTVVNNSDFVLHEDADVVKFLCRYAITVWYFDADERARAKEKYLTGETHALSHTEMRNITQD